MKLREISLAVENLSAAAERFSALLGARPSDVIEVTTPPVQARFVSLDTGGPVSIALMESTEAGSAIERFLERRGEGLFSITFAVDDIGAAMSRMRKEGVEFVLGQPLLLKDYSTGHVRYRECLVNFTRPRSTGGLVMELQQLTK
jgi:methylmalonyl-CoA/ethylmalonyl-CoA epimerase